MTQTLFATALVLTAFSIAFAALYALSLLDQHRLKRTQKEHLADKDQTAFLFESEHLVDATPQAKSMMQSLERSDNSSDWQHLSLLLRPSFPDLENQMSRLADKLSLSLKSVDRSCQLDATWCDGLARLTIADHATHASDTGIDRHRVRALESEVDILRSTSDNTPFVIWREDEAGTITWANRNYMDLAQSQLHDGENPTWPPAKLFEQPKISEARTTDAPLRMALPCGDEERRRWFDIHQEVTGSDVIFTASPADKIVKAEKTLSEFVGTLTKTFAHLPIGLAIFDRDRRLNLFNPALTDLVALPVDYLVGKPTLFSFLDNLRERRMMPEPKDYKSWRQQLSELETAAINGTYSETWSMPSGQTYRVSGRPHPEGAVAFLFEDITAEISLTRRFRAELEMGQSALDCLDDAVAVFSPTGSLNMSNQAYMDMWRGDPEATLEEVMLADTCQTWSKLVKPNEFMHRLQKFVGQLDSREAWSDELIHVDGRHITCHVQPMVRGATMVRFVSPTPSAQPVKQKKAKSAKKRIKVIEAITT